MLSTGEMLKGRIPPGENSRLPESAHVSVAVGKRMNEFELVVESAVVDQPSIVGMFEPVEEIGDQFRKPFVPQTGAGSSRGQNTSSHPPGRVTGRGRFNFHSRRFTCISGACGIVISAVPSQICNP